MLIMGVTCFKDGTSFFVCGSSQCSPSPGSMRFAKSDSLSYRQGRDIIPFWVSHCLWNPLSAYSPVKQRQKRGEGIVLQAPDRVYVPHPKQSRSQVLFRELCSYSTYQTISDLEGKAPYTRIQYVQHGCKYIHVHSGFWRQD